MAVPRLELPSSLQREATTLTASSVQAVIEDAMISGIRADVQGSAEA